MPGEDASGGFDPTCPDCEAPLAGEYGEVPATATEETIRVAVDCPDCGAALNLVVESALPDALGVDLRIEQRG